MSWEALRFQAVGECFAARFNSRSKFVLDCGRAMLCGRFIQLPNMVGRSCRVCQHFQDYISFSRGRRGPRVRGGVALQRGGFS